ncbi:MAG: translation initiation factor 2 [Ruminococcaceae bacterium]|nr:translation initiation factor 2 [Oscillospiraceae bacterium]
MVKGISRQVIVVEAPEPKLFEQAIFILRKDAPNVTDEALLKEAKGLIGTPAPSKWMEGPVWALAGGLLVAVLWIVSSFL